LDFKTEMFNPRIISFPSDFRKIVKKIVVSVLCIYLSIFHSISLLCRLRSSHFFRQTMLMCHFQIKIKEMLARAVRLAARAIRRTPTSPRMSMLAECKMVAMTAKGGQAATSLQRYMSCVGAQTKRHMSYIGGETKTTLTKACPNHPVHITVEPARVASNSSSIDSAARNIDSTLTKRGTRFTRDAGLKILELVKPIKYPIVRFIGNCYGVMVVVAYSMAYLMYMWTIMIGIMLFFNMIFG
jgi:hypothetical protein